MFPLSTSGQRIAVVDGIRTPFTKQGGALRSMTTLDLSVAVVGELAKRLELSPEVIGSLVLGSAMNNPAVPYLARETAIALGWDAVNAYSAETACATSARTVANAAYELLSGEAEIAIAGGAESMSNLQQLASRKAGAASAMLARKPEQGFEMLMNLTMGDLVPPAPVVAEPYSGLTLGEHAEEIVEEWGVTREWADEIAVRSHHNAARAIDEGRLPAETMAVQTPDGTVKEDAIVRADTSMEAVAKLRPVFKSAEDGGTVTAANASPLTDGASAVVLATERACETHGLIPKAWIRSWAFTSHAPKKGVLLGPTYATPLALERAGLTMADIGLFDMHEAFAGQVAANLAAMDSDEWAQQEMGRESAMGRPSDDILNVNGGSVAIGHPFGATGTRIIIQLMNEMQRRDVRYGALAICAGGTRGASMVLERV